MANNFFKKLPIFFLASLLLFFSNAERVFGQPGPVTETVNITATVGSSSDDVVANSGSSGNIIGQYPNAGVFVSGKAYPLAKVNILKDGVFVVSTIAGLDSNFYVTLGNLPSGNYTFSVYAVDKNGIKSRPFIFEARITTGLVTNISGIFIAPTISVNKKEVKYGEDIIISGHSISNADISITLNSLSARNIFLNTTSDSNGFYSTILDTSILELGNYTIKSNASKETQISPDSFSIGLLVGTTTVFTDGITIPQVIIHFLNRGGEFISETVRVNTPLSISSSWANFIFYFILGIGLLIIILLLRYLLAIYVRNLIKKENSKKENKNNHHEFYETIKDILNPK